MNATTTDRREDLLARLERVGCDLEEIAESLPVRGDSVSHDQITGLAHRLHHTVSAMDVLAEETWTWVQGTGEAAVMQRIDARAQENIRHACQRLEEISTALRLEDHELTYWTARDVLLHARACGDHLLRLCGFGEAVAA